jgi:hypothetical protein
MLVKTPGTRRLAVLLFALGVAAFGCTPTTTPPRTSAPVPGASPATAPSGAPSGVPAGVTETDWGQIRDALPPGFPLYPGSTPTQTGGGPASAVLEVPGDVTTVTTWLQGALEGAGFSTLSLSGPFEDGAMEIESVGPTTQCRVRTTIAPLGGSTVVTVLYGAVCPAN